MIQGWQKFLLNARKSYRQVFTADATVTLDADRYIFSLVGGGANGIGGFTGMQANSYVGAAQGGVGGTLKVLVNLPQQTTLNLYIGKGAPAGTFYNSQTHSGVAGGDTYIIGISGVTMRAGGGTAPQVTVANGVITPVAGVQGTNSQQGVVRVISDNEKKIISTTKTGQFRAGPRPAERVLNTNIEDYITNGSAGDNGWEGPQRLLAISGMNGIIIIESE